MAKKTPDQIAADKVRRAKQRPQAAPRELSPAAKRVWRAAVSSREAAFFDAAAQGLLVAFCEWSVIAERLRNAPPEAFDMRAAKDAQHVTNMLADRLRLSPKTSVNSRGQRIGHDKPPPTHRLLGGRAVVDAASRFRGGSSDEEGGAT